MATLDSDVALMEEVFGIENASAEDETNPEDETIDLDALIESPEDYLDSLESMDRANLFDSLGTCSQTIILPRLFSNCLH